MADRVPSARVGIKAQGGRPLKRNRAGGFLMLTASAGLFSAAIAGYGLAPVGAFWDLLTGQGHAAPIAARSIFPPAPAVRQQVDVYDPAPSGARPAAAPALATAPNPHATAPAAITKPVPPTVAPSATAKPNTLPTHGPRSTPTPSPTPEGD